jgi:hypothetical protein
MTKNQIEEQFIFSQSFHRTPGVRIQEITVRMQFKPRILKSFEPANQDQYQNMQQSMPRTPQDYNHTTHTARQTVTRLSTGEAARQDKPRAVLNEDLEGHRRD